MPFGAPYGLYDAPPMSRQAPMTRAAQNEPKDRQSDVVTACDMGRNPCGNVSTARFTPPGHKAVASKTYSKRAMPAYRGGVARPATASNNKNINKPQPIPARHSQRSYSDKTVVAPSALTGQTNTPDAIDSWRTSVMSETSQGAHRRNNTGGSNQVNGGISRPIATPASTTDRNNSAAAMRPRHQGYDQSNTAVSPSPIVPASPSTAQTQSSIRHNPPPGVIQLADNRQTRRDGQARPIEFSQQPSPSTKVIHKGVDRASSSGPAHRRSAGKSEVYYPSGDRRTSALLLERTVPVEVRLGETYDYEIKLTNITNADIGDMTLEERVPSAFKVNTTTPKATGGSTLQWTLGTLGSKASKVFRINGAATSTGELRYCATVTFTTEMCSTNRIVQPQLALSKTAPPEVIVCDTIPLRFVVTNTGSGVARNVRINDTLPAGLSAINGRNTLVFQAGDLGAGQSREFSATVKASSTGVYDNTATATEDGGLTAEASTQTRVVQPVLAVSKTGPEVRYLGRPATYEITVSNNGDAPARDTVLADEMPSSLTLREVSDNGQFSGGKVSWKLGTLEPGSSKTVTVNAIPTQITTVSNTATAEAYCAQASDSFTMIVKGIPAILLEVIDIQDPIEVGASTTYEIRVLNQGSAKGTNIVITCVIPPQEEYISATGPTSSSVQGKTVSFAPLPLLAPKEQATYRLVVKGTAMADVRFRVSMTSDQAQVPVEETESTNIYQ